MTRPEFINFIPKDGSILEIGPFFNPICIGKNVKYFDILNQDELIKRANNINNPAINVTNIPFIDFVSKTGDLSIINEKFDAVISSHVIEHQLDLIYHLQLVSNLLRNGGKYFLIIPDKRYCFDHFNKESTIADIILGNTEKRDKHSIKSVIEHRALTTHNFANRHWNGDHGTIENILHRIKAAIAEYNSGQYIDVHAWYFTPLSFSKIIMLLRGLNLIDFIINECFETSLNSLEFYTILKKVAVLHK